MPDDFSRIRGMNPKIVRRLHEAGIETFAALAEKNAGELAERIGARMGVTAAQIIRQDWVGQAALLAGEGELGEETHSEGDPEAAVPHVANYVIELFLDRQHRVNRTRIHDVGSGEEEIWQSWDPGRLLNFFANRPDLKLPVEETAEPAQAEQQLVNPPTRPVTIPAAATGPSMKTVPPGHMEIIPEGFNGPSSILGHDQSFEIRLALALADTGGSHRPLAYTAVVMAKSMSGQQTLNLGETSGAAHFDRHVTLNVTGENPPPGFYRTRAVVTLFDPRKKGRNVILRSLVEGSVLQVL